jgi:putative transposase
LPAHERYNSVTFPQVGEHGGAALDGGLLSLSQSGRISVRLHRPLEGTPKTVTISREADGWYVCFSCAQAPVQPVPPTGQETGIDLGIDAFATRYTHLLPRLVAEGRTRAENRPTARLTSQEGCHRRRKAIILLAKAHQQVRRQRGDFHHKTAFALVRATDVISHEDWQTAHRLKNHHLAKSIQDAGWAAFLSILAFKAVGAGKRVQAVNPAFTSQRCSGCGVLVQKRLSVRLHACPDYGASLHRDHNAAKKRERLGQSPRGGVVVAASKN